ncbi:MAG: heavy metal translocating P-type ATPase [Bacilli bacterium]|nr:heavy metal translocating P-type ATPase [Bacilli bacterium]
MKNLVHKIPNMDTLVLFSVTFSFIYSIYGYVNIILGSSQFLGDLYFESTCMVIYFIQLGRYIESISKDKTKDSIRKLVQITPQNAILKAQNQHKKVSIDEVKHGDTLICKAGDKIAVDGKVCKGSTYVDESFITGESIPILKNKGSKVIAGSICYDGYIEYQAEKIGRNSTISDIIRLVVEATNTKSKIQTLTDKISGYFVPFIIMLSLLTFLFQALIGISFRNSLIHMVTVLVVACPCSLGLAVPLIVVISNGICAKKGLFLRNSSVLENARKVDTIVFDKTGTLTFGKLGIFKIYNYSSYKKSELLDIVANIENFSSHPISTAFSIKKRLEVENVKIIHGKGITGYINGNEYYLGNDKILNGLKLNAILKKDYAYLVKHSCSIIYLIENDIIIGLIGVRDVVRKDIKNSIQRLNDNHIKVVMLTGDNLETANMVADELGIKNVMASMIPQKKAEYIRNLVDRKRNVMMIGDGINDAPALINATIEVSINDGTDIAMDASDVILMNNNIDNIIDLIKISKKSYRFIKQNLFWAFFYNLCMIQIAMGLFEKFGISMTPMFGSIAMILSSLTVVVNSLRLKNIK